MTTKYKYPRTLHLPFSPGATSDDKKLSEDQTKENFHGKHVTITEKLDGECTTIACDYTHARSLDSAHHPSRDWVKKFQSEIGHNIPEGWRICGENMFAQHSISYDNLDSYFYGFSIWNENNVCLSSQETKLWFELLGIQHVPIISEEVNFGNWEDSLFDLSRSIVKQGKEGLVMRLSSEFHYSDFHKNVAKYVRANHVKTDQHWSHQQIIPNKLKNN